jgi:hypothetical protein
MDWGDLAEQLIGLGAPLLGTALGGPLGGAAGAILAKALGSEARGGAGQPPPADPAKLAEAESLWAETIRAEAETQRTAIAETHATIRAEIESNDAVQRWWQPAYAWELADAGMRRVMGGAAARVLDRRRRHHQRRDRRHHAAGHLLGLSIRRARRLLSAAAPAKSSAP